MSLVDIVVQRFDDLKFRVMERRASFTQPSARRVINFRNPASNLEKRAIPTFGAEPGAFGEDWASYRQPKPRPFGPVPIEHENSHGYVDPNSERPIEPSEPYEDPSLGAPRKSVDVGTDQRPISGIHEANYDKPIVLHNEPHKSFQSSKPKGDPTEGDRAEKDLKNYPYDFSS